MTGYQSKKEAASAKTIGKVNWADHEPDGLAQPEQEPVPCCGKYETCTQACTPRGRFLGKREALAQPAQEPLEYWNAVEGWVKVDEVREHFDSVGCGTIYKMAGEDRVPLYTTPPQRKPLTDEEIDRVTDQQWAQNNHKPIYAAHRAYARAIEAAHGIKEKNA